MPFKIKITAAVIGSLILVAIFACGVPWLVDSRKPDYQTMRKYVVARLTEAQLNSAHAKAVAEFAAERERRVAEMERERTEHYRAAARCGEIGFREKNPDVCSTPLSYFYPVDPILTDVHTRYEMKIMGDCMFVQTVREAKALDCLPSP